MFNWEQMEPNEYQRSSEPAMVELTKRAYITATGHAQNHTDDPAFLKLADGVQKVAATIADSPNIGIEVPGFKEYRPYPVQAVWTPDGDGERFKIWLKQPLFIHEDTFDAAKAHTDLEAAIAGQIGFEQLAEGTEAQATGTGESGANAVTLQGLRTSLATDGYQVKKPGTYREVYLDGVPVTDNSDVLFRLEIDPNVGNPRVSVMN